MATTTLNPPPTQVPQKILDDPELRGFFVDFIQSFYQLWNNNKDYLSGEGTPEGVVVANVGTVFIRTDGGSGTVLYIKETGTDSSGWISK